MYNNWSDLVFPFIIERKFSIMPNVKANSDLDFAEQIINSLKKGVSYEYVVEKFSNSDQRFENAEKSLERFILKYIEEQEDDDKKELYDFVAIMCPRFPTICLARKIATSSLTRKDFIKINNITSKMYDKVPYYLELRQTHKEKNEQINSVKMCYKRHRKSK